MNLRSLLVVLMVVLAGCVTPHRAPEVTSPVLISENTWRQVDRDIVAASQAATGQARIFARGSMEHWRIRVYERTEESFIPWFSSYWTQEWLAMKVTWYRMNAGEEKDLSEKRLTVYFQEQYHDRVLTPVAVEIDPDAILGQATEVYVQVLGKQLQAIAQRYGVSAAQLDRRLKDISAITLAPPPAHNASLYQIVHTDPITKLPAYVALIDRIHNAAGGTGAGASEAAISSVAKQTSEKLEAQIASRGAVGAAAAVAGRVVGALISVGVAGARAVAHESERPEMEAQVRKSLGAAFDDVWLKLLNNPTTGVMAGVNYLSGKIEGSLAKTIELPVVPGPAPREVPLPGTQPLEDGNSDGQAPSGDGGASE
ncbi:hypothetical protein ACN1C3_08300 [Pseudomonas sp. H11T01]|uniref:hypothetical protein n=1 Tax=Pseudomonas sp. H11T01 TaxID=3402749 RepID=UPI003AC64207